MSYRSLYSIFILLLVLLTACQQQEESLPTLVELPTKDETAISQFRDMEDDLERTRWEITGDNINAYSCKSTECDVVLILQSGNIIEVLKTENGWHYITNGSIEYYIEEQYTLQIEDNLEKIRWEITGDNINAYSCKSTECDVVLILQSGNIIEVLKTEDGWHYIANGSIEYYIEEQYTLQIKETDDATIPATIASNITVTAIPSMTITNTLDPSVTVSATQTATATDTSNILKDNTNSNIDTGSTNNTAGTSSGSSGGNSNSNNNGSGGGTSGGTSSGNGTSPTNTPTKRATAVVMNTLIPSATDQILPSPVLPSLTPTTMIDEVLPTPVINISTPVNDNDEPPPPLFPTLIGADQEPPPPLFPTLIGADQEPPPPVLP